MRIVWYLVRYHDIKISDASVSRILRHNLLHQWLEQAALRHAHVQASHEAQSKTRSPHIFVVPYSNGREIRTDIGHEFHAKFHWYEDLGFRHAYIKRGTPQLNEKVERSHSSDGQEFYQ